MLPPGAAIRGLGARNLEQLSTCLAAADIVLAEDEYAAISALSPAPAPAHDRNDEPTVPDR